MNRFRRLARGALPLAGCLFLMGHDECGAGQECSYGGKVRHGGDTFPSEDGCNTCSCHDGQVACTERACAPQWFTTCGDPVCQGHTVDPSVPACTTEKAGDACAVVGVRCDPGDACNAKLQCANSDPRQQQGGCPISRARHKKDIRYLDAAGLEPYRRSLLDLKLATYHYKGMPAGSPQQLGFLIDDVGPGPAVNPDGETVNLYGYASMAVATLQLQAAEIAALKEELAQLKQQLAGPSRPRHPAKQRRLP